MTPFFIFVNSLRQNH